MSANEEYSAKDVTNLTRQRRILLLVLGSLFVITVGLFVGLLLVGVKVAHPQEELYCLTSACTSSAAELMHGFNRSQDPCEDFYEYVCGNEAPPQRVWISNGQFSRTENKMNDKMAPLLYSTNIKTEPAAVQKAVLLMRVCTNFTNMTDEKNLKHLREFIQQFGGWPIATPGEWDPRRQLPLHRLIAAVISEGYQPLLFMFHIFLDEKQPGIVRITLDQPTESDLDSVTKLHSDLTLDVKETEKADKIRKIATWLGNNDTEAINKAIEEIMMFKRDLTEILSSRNERNDDERTYNKMTIRELQRITENKIEWLEILKEVFKDIEEIQDTEEIIVKEVEYMKKLPEILKKYDIRILTNFMIANVLTTVIDEVNLPQSGLGRLYECYNWIKNNMYFAVTRVYLDNYFKEENMDEIKSLVEEIKDAYRDTIQHTHLMDNETRVTALKKLDNMKEVIGYPEWIMNDEMLSEFYDSIPVTDNHLINVISISHNESAEGLQSLREPYNGNSSLELDPTQVNAYYSPEDNKMLIPAAILQAPFFDAEYIQAKNFGTLGAIIGHEIGHGFDSKGRMHDENGVVRQWWTNESLSLFENKTNCFVEQYNQFCPKENLRDKENYPCVDGQYTLTENMADNSGLHEAYKAYKSWTKKYGKYKRLPGLTEFSTDQIFFISFANLWCSTLRGGYYKLLYGDNLHAPTKYRVIGTLSNFPEFAKAFNCPPGPMNRQEESCSLWT